MAAQEHLLATPPRREASNALCSFPIRRCMKTERLWHWVVCVMGGGGEHWVGVEEQWHWVICVMGALGGG
jgi:hypothetical protein